MAVLKAKLAALERENAQLKGKGAPSKQQLQQQEVPSGKPAKKRKLDVAAVEGGAAGETAQDPGIPDAATEAKKEAKAKKKEEMRQKMVLKREERKRRKAEAREQREVVAGKKKEQEEKVRMLSEDAE